ncbi:hypothetical protein HYH03_000870 [Edaphochlamys debaryana]|uniref:Uncharacterized protein n=1 Tax=Edaphochlamys debaryana TaxID=47281 RepID=A0A835YHH2_9CHLO|nr:hypothetical protein HYH03_000870 [Edaphochlamys debaryana]|eukprot:KAG2501051.1 hypothetical protein HYH03_000870 [Edaphochlamys debaryana]
MSDVSVYLEYPVMMAVAETAWSPLPKTQPTTTLAYATAASLAATATATKPSASLATTATATKPSASLAATATATKPSASVAATATATKPSASLAAIATPTKPSASVAATATATKPSASLATTATATKPSASVAATATATKPSASLAATATATKPSASVAAILSSLSPNPLAASAPPAFPSTQPRATQPLAPLPALTSVPIAAPSSPPLSSLSPIPLSPSSPPPFPSTQPRATQPLTPLAALASVPIAAPSSTPLSSLSPTPLAASTPPAFPAPPPRAPQTLAPRSALPPPPSPRPPASPPPACAMICYDQPRPPAPPPFGRGTHPAPAITSLQPLTGRALGVGGVACATVASLSNSTTDSNGRFTLPSNDGSVVLVGGCRDAGSGATLPDGTLWSELAPELADRVNVVSPLASIASQMVYGSELESGMQIFGARLGLGKAESAGLPGYDYVAETGEALAAGRAVTAGGVAVGMANYLVLGSVVTTASLFASLFGLPPAEAVEGVQRGIAFALTSPTGNITSAAGLTDAMAAALLFLAGRPAWPDAQRSSKHARATAYSASGSVEGLAARRRERLLQEGDAGVNRSAAIASLAASLAEANGLIAAQQALLASGELTAEKLREIYTQSAKVVTLASTTMATAASQMGSGALDPTAFRASYTGAALSAAVQSTQLPAPPASEPPPPAGDDGPNVGLIVGVAVGGTVALILIVVVVVIVIRKRSNTARAVD